MPDRELPTLADPVEARAAWTADAPLALLGLTWVEETPNSIAVDMPATRADGTIDMYLLRLDFSYYRDWPPRATFLDRETRTPSAAAWPNVEGAPEVSFHAVYGDAPHGMVCNSLFFEYYFWGGHSPNEGIAWDGTRMTFAASLNLIKECLRPPFYIGPRT